MWIDPGQLKKFLADSGLISVKDLEELAQTASTTQKSFDEVILASGKITEDDLRRAKAYILGIPFVDLSKLKIPQELLFLIPEPIARKHNIVPFHRDAQNLEVAMLDPDDMVAIDFIKKGVGLKILPRLTDTASIKSALLQYQKSLKAEFGDIIKEEASKLALTQDGAGTELGESELKKTAAIHERGTELQIYSLYTRDEKTAEEIRNNTAFLSGWEESPYHLADGKHWERLQGEVEKRMTKHSRLHPSVLFTRDQNRMTAGIVLSCGRNF
jgi:hypothetical protein